MTCRHLQVLTASVRCLFFFLFLSVLLLLFVLAKNSVPSFFFSFLVFPFFFLLSHSYNHQRTQRIVLQMLLLERRDAPKNAGNLAPPFHKSTHPALPSLSLCTSPPHCRSLCSYFVSLLVYIEEDKHMESTHTFGGIALPI